jgi:hypothetical protein
MNSQFKFKPDKIKYLSNVDTLDSTHKKITSEINKKRDDVEKKKIKLFKFKNELDEINYKKNEFVESDNFIEIRAKLIENISKLEEEIEQINNYDEETEYYAKTYQILLNYYDMIDGQIENEIKEIKEVNNIVDDIKDDISISNNNIDIQKNEIDEWNLDGIQIFNSAKTSVLDSLYESSKKKRKEKKSTRKRVKNVESLIKDNNYDIFEFINLNKNNNGINITDNLNNAINKTNLEYDVYDRAQLYDDYKITLEGYNSKKKHSKICDNCNVEKILIYSEGLYACMKCGEVENCIIESEITNYKEPMVEKPTFPYKRKNHFCEWKLGLTFLLLIKVIVKSNGYFLY